MHNTENKCEFREAGNFTNCSTDTVSLLQVPTLLYISESLFECIKFQGYLAYLTFRIYKSPHFCSVHGSILTPRFPLSLSTAASLRVSFTCWKPTCRHPSSEAASRCQSLYNISGLAFPSCRNVKTKTCKIYSAFLTLLCSFFYVNNVTMNQVIRDGNQVFSFRLPFLISLNLQGTFCCCENVLKFSLNKKQKSKKLISPMLMVSSNLMVISQILMVRLISCLLVGTK